MNSKANYVLSEYYQIYKLVKKGYPHTISEMLGIECEKVINHSKCCSLEISNFLHLGKFVDINNDCEYSYLLCKANRLIGNKAIRKRIVERPQEITPKQLFCIRTIAFAMFTHQFEKHAETMNLFTKILTATNIDSDIEVRNFFEEYMEEDGYISCDNNLGLMVNQTIELYDRLLSIPNSSVFDFNLLKKLLYDIFESIIKTFDNIQEYQTCG